MLVSCQLVINIWFPLFQLIHRLELIFIINRLLSISRINFVGNCDFFGGKLWPSVILLLGTSNAAVHLKIPQFFLLCS